MNKHTHTVVTESGHADVLAVLRTADDSKPGSAAWCDIAHTAADEIERLRRKCNRVLMRLRLADQERYSLRCLAKGLIDAIREAAPPDQKGGAA